jgi:hypothetical protein
MTEKDQIEGQGGGGEAPDEAALAWQEFDTQDTGSETSPDSYDDPAPETGPEGGEDDGQDDSDGQGKDAPSDQAKAGSDKLDTDSKGGGSNAPGADGQDDSAADEAFWAKAPPEYRQAYLALQESKKNIAAREAGQNRTVQKLLTEIRALKAGVPTADGGGKAPAGKGKDYAPGKPGGSRAILEGLDDYEEIKGPLEKALGIIDGRLAKVESMEAEAAARELAKVYEDNEKLLLHHVPNAFDVAGSNDFMAWIEDQSDEVRAMFQKNAAAITDARSALSLFKLYEMETGGAGGGSAPSSPNGSDAGGQDKDKISSRRQRQLEGAAAPNSRGGPPIVGGIPEEGDPEQIWRMFDEQERRQQA